MYVKHNCVLYKISLVLRRRKTQLVKISHKILTILLQKTAVAKSNALLMVSSRINSSSDVKTLLHSNNWLT